MNKQYTKDRQNGREFREEVYKGRALVEHVYGDTSGYMAIFSGVRKKPTDKELTFREQRVFEYPQELGKALSYADKKARERNREMYWGVHLLKSRGSRRKDNAAPVGCLYAELDGGERLAGEHLATAIVQSSPGRYHIYVRLTRAIDPARAENLNKRLALLVGADPSGHDLSQVLRIPGTRNHKYTDKPTVRILTLKDSEARDPDELDRRLPPLPEPPDAEDTATKEATNPITLDDEGLLDRARNARGQAGVRFRRRHDQGDISGDNDDHSLADFNHCRDLAFWTAWDAERIDRLFRASALCQKPERIKKWDRVGKQTIKKAIAATPKAYRQPAETDPKLVAIAECLRAEAESDPWKGRGGPVDRCVFETLIELATEHGSARNNNTLIVSADQRTIALRSGVSTMTASRSLQRLEKDRKRIKRLRRGKGTRGGVYRLNAPQDDATLSVTLKRCVHICNALRRLRNRAPEYRDTHDKNGRKLPTSHGRWLGRVGKAGGLIIERVFASPGITIPELARALDRRACDVRRTVRWLADCPTAMLIVGDSERVSVAEDFETRLEIELEVTGCLAAAEYDRKRYAEQREAYRKELAGELPDADEVPDLDARYDERVGLAFEAFCREGQGPQRILHTYLAGATKFDYVITAVAVYYGSAEPVLWESPVCDAYALYVGEEVSS